MINKLSLIRLISLSNPTGLTSNMYPNIFNNIATTINKTIRAIMNHKKLLGVKLIYIITDHIRFNNYSIILEIY